VAGPCAIYGDTRSALMFGIGYATAEDRLFFIDVLRHSGQGDLSAFAGGANIAMDKQVWADEPYTQQDLVNQIDYMSHQPGGTQLLADATSYVNGINAYINKAEQPLNTLTMIPAEYAAIGQPQGPQAFTLENLVSIATLVGGIFGNGGGDQLFNAMLYENMAQKFGRERRSVAGSPVVIAKAKTKKKKTSVKKKAKAKSHKSHKSPQADKADKALVAAGRTHNKKPAKKKKKTRSAPAADHSGFATFLSFDDPNDREAPTTVHKAKFPYQTLPMPSKAVVRTIALPDRGSVQMAQEVVGGASAGRRPQAGAGRRTPPPREPRAWGSAPPPTSAPGCSPSPARCRTRCWSAPRTRRAAIRWR
jgi:hypothetical protein